MIARRIHGEVVLRYRGGGQPLDSAERIAALLAMAFAQRATTVTIEADDVDPGQLTALIDECSRRRVRLVVLGADAAGFPAAGFPAAGFPAAGFPAAGSAAGATCAAPDDRVWFLPDEGSLDARLAQLEAGRRISMDTSAPDRMLPYPRPMPGPKG